MPCSSSRRLAFVWNPWLTTALLPWPASGDALSFPVPRMVSIFGLLAAGGTCVLWPVAPGLSKWGRVEWGFTSIVVLSFRLCTGGTGRSVSIWYVASSIGYSSRALRDPLPLFLPLPLVPPLVLFPVTLGVVGVGMNWERFVNGHSFASWFLDLHLAHLW